MTITLQPMLGEPALIPLALIVLIVLMIPVVAAAVGIGVFLRVRSRRKGEMAASQPAQPPVQPAPRKCLQCGADLKPDAPEGLCPACLLKQGIATEGGVPPGTHPFTPPSPAELAKLFPQLEILEPIGQGGMGAVYKARQPALDRLVALKILAPRGGGDLDFAGRFTREARALARLSHPNIVAVHDFGQVSLPSTPDPRPLNYFLMEYVDGPNLRQVEQAGKLTPREALQIIPQICAALQFAHDEGIVHRDIKPENVLVDKKGRVKIADFGLAKILGQEADFRLTGARDVMGTPHYMAPEQVEKPQEVDHRADIYSLGVVFYEMLTGELPLGRFEPPSQRAQVDVRLDEVVLRSLEKSPERRYQHVSEVKTHVETIASSAAQLKTPAKTGAAPSSLPRFQAIAFTIASVLMALLLLSAGWAANRMGIFFNALFLFILLMVPVRIVLILWHTFHGTVEYRLWRTPLAPELGKYRWRVLNRWVFWLLAAVVLKICIVPAQFYPEQLATIRVLVIGGVVVLILLELLPPRRSYLATNAVYVVGSFFMAVQIARIYWPESKAHAVVLSMPVRGDWLVVNGGNSSLINIHYPFKEQRNAVDMEKLVDGHERTGDAHKLESYPSWGQTVYAPTDGKIAVAQGNLDDNAVGEMDRDNPVGNHICIDLGNGRYVMLAHLQKNSLEVSEGDTVHLGQPLAKCGNSGNTSHPHLHIQVQDAPRIFVTGKRDATTYPVLFCDAIRVRANRTVSGAPFFVRRNDEITPGALLASAKLITLNRPANQAVGALNDTHTVSVWNDVLSPDETLSAWVKVGTNKMHAATAMQFVHWQPEREGMSAVLTWFFGGAIQPGFGETEAETALAQLRGNIVDRPISLLPGEPFQLFAVTNQAGVSMAGYVEYKRIEQATAVVGSNVQAVVQIQRIGGFYSWDIDYSVSVPPGYLLRATANRGSVDSHTPAGPYQYHSDWRDLPFPVQPSLPPVQPGQQWQPPRSHFESPEERRSQQKEFQAQLQSLKDQGSFVVLLGQPKLLFSLTNSSGEVYQGFFELIGGGSNTPPSPAAIGSLESPAPPTPPEPVPLPPQITPQIIRPLRTLPSRSVPPVNLSTNDSASSSPEQQPLVIEAQRIKTAPKE